GSSDTASSGSGFAGSGSCADSVLVTLSLSQSVELASPPCVIPKNPEAIEDRGGVPQNVPGVAEIHGAFKLVIESDRRLGDFAEPEKPSYHQQLEIKSKALDGQQRHCLLEHLAAKELEPGLRIADVQVEEDFYQQLVDRALEPAKRWIRD